MSRVAIRFERFSNTPSTFRLHQTPQVRSEPTIVEPFRLTQAQVQGPPRTSGETLFAALGNNKDVSEAFDFVFGQETLVPVYLEMAKGAESADAFPWEYLFSNTQRFLALSEFWPIARSLYSASLPNVTFRELTITAGRPQIRVLVVLGAGDDWEWEWKAFRALSEKAKEQRCDLRLRILVGHGDASRKINREAGADIASPFKNLDELWALVRDETFLPNVIHFLCHGTGGTDPVMHCATILDYETETKERFDVIAPSELLRQIPKTQFLWMIVLNCCELADATAESQQSFARGLLGNEAPVVIAHRAPIEVTDAAEVTRGLYESILNKAKVAAHLGPRDVDWADVLAIARDRLISKHRKGTGPQTAESTVQWSLPVVYVTSPGFVMLTNHGDPDPAGSARAATNSAMQGELLDVDQLPDKYREHIDNIEPHAVSGHPENVEDAATVEFETAAEPKREEEEDEGLATC
jgi:CHAT domain-containing protein